MTFDMAAPDNIVEYDLWYTSSDDRALDFLDNMQKYDLMLNKHTRFTPRFVYWECELCEDSLIKKNCFAGGKYCAIDTTNDKIKGVDIILEDLRQKCLHQNLYLAGNRADFWRYLVHVHSSCEVLDASCSMMAH